MSSLVSTTRCLPRLAGRDLPVGDARTMLAGWNPDETWWLGDALSADGSAERWVTTEQDQPFGWNNKAPQYDS